MLQIIKGAYVPDAKRLMEGCRLEEHRITANVNADKIRTIMEHFLKMNEDIPLFLFIEVPANIRDETLTGETDNDGFIVDTFHKDIYYLDGIPAQTIRKIFQQVFDILLHDGLSSFGIGNATGEEIGKYKYNIMQLFCRDAHTEKYALLFEDEDIPRTENFITAWDTFTQEAPGCYELYKNPKGKDIYDVVKWLEKMGLYKAEVRED